MPGRSQPHIKKKKRPVVPSRDHAVVSLRRLRTHVHGGSVPLRLLFTDLRPIQRMARPEDPGLGHATSAVLPWKSEGTKVHGTGLQGWEAQLLRAHVNGLHLSQPRLGARKLSDRLGLTLIPRQPQHWALHNGTVLFFWSQHCRCKSGALCRHLRTLSSHCRRTHDALYCRVKNVIVVVIVVREVGVATHCGAGHRWAACFNQRLLCCLQPHADARDVSVKIFFRICGRAHMLLQLLVPKSVAWHNRMERVLLFLQIRSGRGLGVVQEVVLGQLLHSHIVRGLAWFGVRHVQTRHEL
mmetsp:Transcript_27253/g.43392  ORF Transcript_27253/g.43392 Transcript_27253/m.43392 type:complete len:297 (-) Transcript_27253:1754-2644(-)